MTGYDFEIADGDRARAEDALEEVEGVEVSLAGGVVSVAYGPDEVLARAWRVLAVLAGAGYSIYDPQRGRDVDVDEDFEAVLTTYTALQRLPGR